MKEEYSFLNKDKEILYGLKWEIDKTKAKGVVVLITGMAEHSGRYDDFSTFLNNNGYHVYCLDHYGQGKNGENMNPGKDFFFKYIETLKDFNKLLRANYSSLPIINIAHSMGSFILQGYIEKYSTTIDKCVLIGTNGPNPLIGIGNLLAKMFIHKGNYNKKDKFFHNLTIGSYIKSVDYKESPNEWISYNIENVRNYDDDPLSGNLPTNGFYKEFLNGLASIQKSKNIENISKKLKILIIGGKEDAVGNFSKGLLKLDKLYKKHGLNSSLIIMENMRHEVLNEVDKDLTYNHILEFINK